jgi:protein-disulfide isomerase
MADALTPPFLRGHDHSLGDGGPVLLAFGDYEDPDTAALQRAVTELRTRWDGFTFAFRHLPLGEHHPHANGAALAAEGAAAQDAFWPYHELLLARQEALGVADLLLYAGELGVDVELLMDDMREGRHAERVLDDVRSAVSSGVKTTPALFVAGVPYVGGFQAAELEAALRAALAG